MADEKKPKGPSGPKMVIDTSIIEPKRIEELKAKAKAKVEKERQLAAEAQLLEEMELEERRAGGLIEPMVDITIDLAPYADRLMLDGKIFFQGQTKTVPESVASVILDMQQSTWRHQSIVDGKSENFYRRSRSQGIAANGGVISHILRA
jgi:hypothetical protein